MLIDEHMKQKPQEIAILINSTSLKTRANEGSPCAVVSSTWPQILRVAQNDNLYARTAQCVCSGVPGIPCIGVLSS
jgi:hypothetical protein